MMGRWPTLVASAILLWGMHSWAGPKLYCDDNRYDFGAITGNDRIVHEFKLENRGDEDVRISKIKNCCGVQSSVEPMIVPPGSNALCRAVFTTRNRYGAQDKQILIGTNDKKRPYLELKMTGTLLRPIEYSPRFVQLGSLTPGAEISRTVTATNLLDKPVVLQRVESRVIGIKATISDAEENRWVITLESSGMLAVGKLSGQIDLFFSSGTVSAPVAGTVKPIIQTTPSQVQLPASSGMSTRYVMLRSDTEHPFKVLSSEIRNGKGTVTVTKKSDHCWQFKLILSPEELNSEAVLHLATSEPLQKEICIPLIAR